MGCGKNKQPLTPSFKIVNLNPSILLSTPVCYYDNESTEYIIYVNVVNISHKKIKEGHTFTSFFTDGNLPLDAITDDFILNINPGAHQTIKLLFTFAPSEIPEKILMASKP